MKQIFTTLASLAVGIVLLISSAGVADAAVTSKVLGADGTIYRLHLGNSAEFLPQAGSEDTFLAALEVTSLSGESSWHIVPDTAVGQNRESAATLLYEPATETLFLVWETRVNFIHSILNLASFQEGEWSAVTQLRGGWVTPRSTPQAVVTRDEYPSVDGSGTIHRVILHLVWWEANEQGEQVLYTPVILENGQLVEIQDALVLGDLPTLTETPEARLAVANSFLQAPAIRNAPDANTVLIGFADGVTGLQRTVEARAISGQLTASADRLRSRIVDFAGTYQDPTALADAARNAALEAASTLHPSLRIYLGQRIYELISPISAEDLDAQALAEQAHRIVIEVGDSLSGTGLVNFTSTLRSRIVDFSSTAPHEGSPTQSFTFRPVSDRFAPLTPEAPSSLYLSASGRHALVAWEEDGGISYVQTTTDGQDWTDVVFLKATPDLSFSALHEMLRGHTDNR